eukprot:c5278_g1_i1.p1 GENE.c5278_g1_i1~~c5278_g1_i1.p1  ORF type:complete len:429 (+),score=85.29 c5278_g1_i1:320-1606(+)
MAIGYFMLTVRSLFFIALCFIAFGNGFFKPNVSTQIGQLYKSSELRDQAFSIFYVGINLGGFVSPLICGAIANATSYRYGFMASGIGMIISLITLIGGRHKLKAIRIADSGSTPVLPVVPFCNASSASDEQLIADDVLSSDAVITSKNLKIEMSRVKISENDGRFDMDELPSYHHDTTESSRSVVEPQTVVQNAYGATRDQDQQTIEEKAPKMTATEWKRVSAILYLCTVNITFWIAFEQQGNTIAHWAKDQTNRSIFGWEFPASWIQSLNPLMIITLTPFLLKFWKWQYNRRSEPAVHTKMAIGCLLCGLSFLVLLGGAHEVESGHKAQWGWLVLSMTVLSLGELYLSPVGLSLVVKLAPTWHVSKIMGFWFLSSAIGNYLSGYVGTFWDQVSPSVFFCIMFAVSASGSALIFAASPFLGPILKHHQ